MAEEMRAYGLAIGPNDDVCDHVERERVLAVEYRTVDEVVDVDDRYRGLVGALVVTDGALGDVEIASVEDYDPNETDDPTKNSFRGLVIVERLTYDSELPEGYAWDEDERIVEDEEL